MKQHTFEWMFTESESISNLIGKWWVKHTNKCQMIKHQTFSWNYPINIANYTEWEVVPITAIDVNYMGRHCHKHKTEMSLTWWYNSKQWMCMWIMLEVWYEIIKRLSDNENDWLYESCLKYEITDYGIYKEHKVGSKQTNMNVWNVR